MERRGSRVSRVSRERDEKKKRREKAKEREREKEGEQKKRSPGGGNNTVRADYGSRVGQGKVGDPNQTHFE